MIQPRHHVFLCTSCRLNGTVKGFCAGQGAVDLVQKLAEQVDSEDLGSEVMITHTGCFGICAKGPVMVVYPDGVWYGGLDEEGIGRIVTEHLAGGRPVEELII